MIHAAVSSYVAHDSSCSYDCVNWVNHRCTSHSWHCPSPVPPPTKKPTVPMPTYIPTSSPTDITDHPSQTPSMEPTGFVHKYCISNSTD